MAEEIKRPPNLGTERGILLGRGAGQHRQFRYYLDQPADFWRTADVPVVFERPAQPSLTSAHPMLEVGPIVQQFYASEEPIAFTMGWPMAATGDEIILVICDQRGPRPFLITTLQGATWDQTRWQRIYLSAIRTSRVLFESPVSGTRCTNLYWRDGCFASREEQRLYHPSQRAVGRKLR